jgi:hypothetical protein
MLILRFTTHLSHLALLSLLLGCEILMAPALAGPIPLESDDAPIKQSFFGIHIQSGKPWPPFPISAQRLTLNWSLMEPEPGVWDFRLADSQVDLAAKHNADLIVGLGFTPKWASSQPDKQCRVGPGTCWEPRRIQDWRDFVIKVGNRYKGRVRYYEIWNEPSGLAFYQSSVNALVTLTQVASQELKAIDPGVEIVSPSPIGPKGFAWMDQFLRQGGGKYVDIIGFHFYFAPAPPESVYGEVKAIREIMAKHDVDNKPLWDTENSWTGDAIPEDLQVAYLARVFLLDRAAGVSRVFWFAWGIASSRIPLVQSDGVTLTTAGRAFQVLEDWLIGANLRSCTSSDLPQAWQASHAMWVCDLDRQGVAQKIVWNPDGDTNYNVPANWKVTRIQYLSGQSASIPPSHRITVGQQPILLDSGG